MKQQTGKRLIYLCLLLAFSFSARAQQSYRARIAQLEDSLVHARENDLRMELLQKLTVASLGFFPDSAKKYTYRLLALSDSLKNTSYQAEARFGLGQIHVKTSDLHTAKKSFLQSLVYAQQTEDSMLLAKIYVHLGETFRKIGIYERALDNCFRAVKIYNAKGNEEGEADVLNTIGLIYNAEGSVFNALKSFNRCLYIRKKLETPSKIPVIYNNLGLVYQKQGNWTTAKEYFQKSLRLADSLKLFQYKASIYNSLSAVYLETDSLQKAYVMALQAKNYGNLTKQPSTIAAAHANLGKYYTKRNKTQSALTELKTALAISVETKSLVLEQDYHEQLSVIYTQLGKQKKALEHYSQYKAISDSLLNEQIRQSITEQRVRFEFEKKIHKQKQQQRRERMAAAREIEWQRSSKYFIYLVLFAVSVVLLFMWRSFYREKKHKRKLEQSHLRIEQQSKQLQKQTQEVESLNTLITSQKERIEKQHKHFMDNVNYARRLQTAIMPDEQLLDTFSKEHFLINIPKDVVSGDFFWCKEGKDFTAFAVADCTGHGVSAGFLTILGLTYLDDIVSEYLHTQGARFTAGSILTHLRKRIIDTLQNTGQFESRQGMDISLCLYFHAEKRLEFAGGNLPLLLARKGCEIEEIKADRMPIGFQPKARKEFATQNITIAEGDWVYLFSDGYLDQFGGKHGQKYFKKKFKRFLSSICHLGAKQQKQELLYERNVWKGNYEQIDDVLVLGIRF